MPDEPLLREKAREALLSGKLPPSRSSRTFGFLGLGYICAVCGQSITHHDMELETEVERPGLEPEMYDFHPRCFAAWEFERTKVPGVSI